MSLYLAVLLVGGWSVGLVHNVGGLLLLPIGLGADFGHL
jgi:hypothetical protein